MLLHQMLAWSYLLTWFQSWRGNPKTQDEWMGVEFNYSSISFYSTLLKNFSSPFCVKGSCCWDKQRPCFYLQHFGYMSIFLSIVCGAGTRLMVSINGVPPRVHLSSEDGHGFRSVGSRDVFSLAEGWSSCWRLSMGVTLQSGTATGTENWPKTGPKGGDERERIRLQLKELKRDEGFFY